MNTSDDSRMHDTLRAMPLALLMLISIGCGQPRTEIVPAARARTDQRAMTVRVNEVFDCMQVTQLTDSSHLIEVFVLDGPSALRGQTLTLPYDEWNVGKPPPAVGAEVRMTPAEWVLRAKSSKGKPATGWSDPRYEPR